MPLGLGLVRPVRQGAVCMRRALRQAQPRFERALRYFPRQATRSTIPAVVTSDLTNMVVHHVDPADVSQHMQVVTDCIVSILIGVALSVMATTLKSR